MRIFIHVGLPKTATSFLQRNFMKVKEKLSTTENTFFFAGYMPIDKKKLSKYSKIIISWEGFSQQIYQKKFEKTIEDLKKFFPNAKITILLVLREQVSLLESMYTQKIKEGKCNHEIYKSFDVFLKNYNHIELDYIKLYKYFQKYAHNVKHFWFEEMLINGEKTYFNWFRKITSMKLNISKPRINQRILNRGLTIEQINEIRSKPENLDMTERFHYQTLNMNNFQYEKNIIDTQSKHEIRKKYYKINKQLNIPEKTYTHLITDFQN